jgi:S-adenosylmethionine-diacylglycerol 3-amino-3-carboxypropyl transferase
VSTTDLPQWVAAAAGLPVAFAQVREDALLDRWVVDRCPAPARAILVASGGCTAAALAAGGRVGILHLVDRNPAQIALTRLKLRLLQTAEPLRRRELLGHDPLDPRERIGRLTAELTALDLSPEHLGPPLVIAAVGPDHAGRYEQVFAALRRELAPVADELAALLTLRDTDHQAAQVAPATALGRALDDAFDRVMDLPVLVRLFGEQATQNRREPFARHFANRTRHALATLPAADNPYLWQVLAGRYPGEAAPWLTMPAPSAPPEVTATVASMDDALAAEPGAFDFVHLSNILDWLSPEEARRTLDRAAAALRPGGWVLVRQLNSTLDIPALGGRIDWQPDLAAGLLARDRSYFYRALHLGRKR